MKDFSGIIENMPIEKRKKRLTELSEELSLIVAENGEINFRKLLEEVAGKLRIAISQVKQALNWSLANKRLKLDSNDMVTIS